MIFNKDSQREHTRTYTTKKGIKTVYVNKGNKKEDNKLGLGIGIGVLGTLGAGYLLRKKLIPKNNVVNVPNNLVKSSQVIPVETFTPKNVTKQVSFPKLDDDFTPRKNNPKFPVVDTISKPKYVPDDIPDPWLDTTPKSTKLDNPTILKSRNKSSWINRKQSKNIIESKVNRSKPKNKQPTRTLIYLGKKTDDVKIASKSKTLAEDLRLPLDSTERKRFKDLMLTDIDSPVKYLQPDKTKVMEIYGKGYPVISKYDLDEEDILALASYTEHGYIGVNSLLRGQLTKSTDEVKAVSTLLARQLNQTLDKLPNYEGRVYRGTRLEQKVIDSFEEGSVIKLEGFTSASNYPDVLEEYTKKYKHPEGTKTLIGTPAEVKQSTKQNTFDPIAKSLGVDTTLRTLERQVEIVINSKTGKNIGQLVTSTPTDLEVLFKSNTRFKVIKKVKDKNKWKLELDEVDYDEVTSYVNNSKYLVLFGRDVFNNSEDLDSYIDRITDRLSIVVENK